MARIAATVLCMALSACGSGLHEDFAAARTDDGPGFAWNRRPSLESSLQAGMPYARFRRELLSRGWEPMPDANCRANLVGARPLASCVASPDLCRVCDEMPELSLYVPDGVALVVFRHQEGGHELQATLAGEITDRSRLDPGSRLRLVAWDIASGR